MNDPTHKAILVLINPNENYALQDFCVGEGPDFGLGRKKLEEATGFRALLTEVNTSSIETTDRALWAVATTTFEWTLTTGYGLTSVGKWVRSYEEQACSREEMTLRNTVLWGKSPDGWP